MKRIVSISVGSSARDHTTRHTFLGQECEISRRGTNGDFQKAIELYKEIMAAYPDLHLIASGGVSCNEDIDALVTAGIPAVVFGKAFYEGKINIDKLGL